MNSLEKWMILTPLQKLPNNVGDLGKTIVATSFEWLPKLQKLAKSGHTGEVPGWGEIVMNYLWLQKTSISISYILHIRECVALSGLKHCAALNRRAVPSTETQDLSYKPIIVFPLSSASRTSRTIKK